MYLPSFKEHVPNANNKVVRELPNRVLLFADRELGPDVLCCCSSDTSRCCVFKCFFAHHGVVIGVTVGFLSTQTSTALFL